MDKLFSRKRYIDKYDAGGNYFYERRANTATPPHYASNNKPSLGNENGSKQKPNTNKYKLFGWRCQAILKIF